MLVRVGAAGVSHSDYDVMHVDMAAQLPAVLGHEGAGVVETVAPGRHQRCVKRLRPRPPRRGGGGPELPGVKMNFAAVVVPVWAAIIAPNIGNAGMRINDSTSEQILDTLADRCLPRRRSGRPRERTRLVGNGLVA